MSTRIIIKNLPHDITSQRLKAHFSSSQSGPTFFSGQITDAKLVTDPKSGKFRGFAFVGYRNPEQAEKAVEWFNGTFLDQRKISVEVAKPVISFASRSDNGRLVISRWAPPGEKRTRNML
jgi:multiple RNA-binding domain-containing protein 1